MKKKLSIVIILISIISGCIQVTPQVTPSPKPKLSLTEFNYICENTGGEISEEIICKCPDGISFIYDNVKFKNWTGCPESIVENKTTFCKNIYKTYVDAYSSGCIKNVFIGPYSDQGDAINKWSELLTQQKYCTCSGIERKPDGWYVVNCEVMKVGIWYDLCIFEKSEIFSPYCKGLTYEDIGG